MTFGAIKSRIADELVRPDLASQIALAVQDAVSEAATTRFWFNEVRGLTFTMAVGQNFYSATDAAFIGQMSKIDTLSIVAQNQVRDLEAGNALDLASWQQGSTPNGQPAYYARQANGLLFFMSPDQAYPVSIDGVTRFAPLVNDTDDNPYLIEGERYVRALAKAIVWDDVIREPDEADRQWARAEREKQKLLSETGNRDATGTVAPFL